MYGFSGTVVGIRCKDGVVLASDSKGVAYYHVLSKRVQKVFKLEDRIGAAIAGSTGDVQSFVNLLRAEANLYRINHETPISTKALAHLASGILHGRRLFPYLLEGVIGGVDNGNEPVLIFLDPVGGHLEEKEFAAAGTGASVAYGALEKDFGKLDVKEGAKLAAKSIQSAIERDAATGERTVVAIIDGRGYRELSEAKVENLLK